MNANHPRRKTSKMMHRSLLASALGLAFISSSVWADQTPFSLDSPWLLGDWGGYRTQLQQEGVDFQANYTMESASNLAGGYRSASSARYADQWAFGSTLDLDKLINWQGAQFQMTVTGRDGQDLTPYINDPRTGGLSSIQEVYGRGQTWRLTQFWLNQKLFNDALEVKVGRVTVGEDFDSSDSKFQNLALGSGQAGNWRGDRWYNWPVSQWGGRIKLNITPDIYLQTGIYNQNPTNTDHGNGFRLDTNGTVGNMVPLELGWKPLLGPEKLPGNYRIGGYYSSTNGDVYHTYNNGQFGEKAHAYGGYVVAEQQLTATDGDTKRGLTLTVQAVMNDKKTSKTDNYQSIAVAWKGPFAARAEDEIGVGAARIHVNDDYGNMQRQQNADNQVNDYNNPTYLPVQSGAEYDFEVYYNAHLTPWLDLRPNLQYVASPGAVSEVKDAFIGGISANVNF